MLKSTLQMICCLQWRLVSCLGACGLAPVMTINEKVYGPIDAKKVESVLDSIIQEDAVEAAL